MFPRVSRSKSGGKVYKYLRVVENYRNEKGNKSQRVIANLGRLEELRKGKLDELVEKLRKFCLKHWVVGEEVEEDEALRWGPVLLARRLWEEMGLDEVVGRLCARRKGDGDVAKRAFVLVANRLTEPGSENGLAWWLESNPARRDWVATEIRPGESLDSPTPLWSDIRSLPHALENSTPQHLREWLNREGEVPNSR